MKFLEYFYVVNYNEGHRELCFMEAKYILGVEPTKKIVISNESVDPSRSAFIKEKISVMYISNSLEGLVNKIKEDKIREDDFKVLYLKSGFEDVEYIERLKSVSKVGAVIIGEPNIHEPKIIFGISKINDKWIFGIYDKNNYEWHIHDRKPFTYSNALNVNVAKAVVNIAVGNDFTTKLVDPCCGIGTVVIEALDLGINIKGYEINGQIVKNAQRNLEFFSFKNVIAEKDMHTITEEFDVAIIDMPYGVFTPTTKEIQNALVKSSIKFTKRLILISIFNSDKLLEETGYKILDKCVVLKNNFKRYITLCER